MDSITSFVGDCVASAIQLFIAESNPKSQKSQIERQVGGAARCILSTDYESQIRIVDFGARQVTVGEVAVIPLEISDERLVDYCVKIYDERFTEQDRKVLLASQSNGSNFNVARVLSLADRYETYMHFSLQSLALGLIKSEIPEDGFWAITERAFHQLRAIEAALLGNLDPVEWEKVATLIYESQLNRTQEVDIVETYSEITQAILELERKIAANPLDRNLMFDYAGCKCEVTEALNSTEISEHPLAQHLFKTHVQPRVDALLERCGSPIRTGVTQAINSTLVSFVQSTIENPMDPSPLHRYHSLLHYEDELDDQPVSHFESKMLRDALREFLTSLENDRELPLRLRGSVIFALQAMIAHLRNPIQDARNPLYGPPVAFQQALTQHQVRASMAEPVEPPSRTR